MGLALRVFLDVLMIRVFRESLQCLQFNFLCLRDLSNTLHPSEPPEALVQDNDPIRWDRQVLGQKLIYEVNGGKGFIRVFFTG
jgi:hypothetical protein